MSDKQQKPPRSLSEERLHLLGRHYVPDHRNLPLEVRQQIEGRNRAERRAGLRKTRDFARAQMTQVAVALENGAGFLADVALREFLLETNHRFMSHGLGALSMSFNVLEAFAQFDAKALVFRLRSEVDHVFSLEDFLDFQTSKDAPSSALEALASMPEGVIHSYNAIGDLEGMAFMDGDGKRFVVAAISFVRSGNELSWQLLGGPIIDLQAETARIQRDCAEQLPEMAKDNPKHLDLSQTQAPKAVRLEGTESVWRTRVLGRTDLTTSRHQVRYLCFDEGWVWKSFSDDPALFGQLGSKPLTNKQVELLRNGASMLDQHAVLSDVATALFSLPAYFKFKIHLVQDRSVPTKLSQNSMVGARRAIDRVPIEERIKLRHVAAIEILNLSGVPAIRTYTPPRFQVEVDGFWRRLSSPEADGVGPAGERVKGRTWIKAHIRWRDQPPPPKVVLVKNSVSIARAKAALLAAVSNGSMAAGAEMPNLGHLPEGTEIVDDGEVEGVLYVLSSPMLDDGIYKVGITIRTAEERAEELSRATGVAMAFVVVDSWRVSNPREKEELVHKALAAHRINPKREFFKVPFATIRRTVDSVLST